ncbi:nucleotidyltransferase domain-containing protein [Candidatus Parcubacteria bacterium]|nr:nucleotidyltransferase domain-containing protein [Patescibacteria group bacterium]MBU4381365.1 nucleotidyltransferase domain-containing protein [Patescibacteria group bacterium]MCG2688871.1 nucleotidyltransferase domain-containing protein [Candidatus Parcubacteria bacterium]
MDTRTNLREKETKKAIKAFKKGLLTAGIRPERLILFGSYAKGTASKNSDIDVCVVSRAFGKDEFSETSDLFKIAWRTSPNIEPIAMNPGRFNDPFDPLCVEIKKYGIPVS